MKEFMQTQQQSVPSEDILEEELPAYLHVDRESNRGKKYYIETHGCQMNVADTEIVQAIMESSGFQHSESLNDVSLGFKG